nr:uncharacterized protein LOC117856523 [Setaria viridis]
MTHRLSTPLPRRGRGAGGLGPLRVSKRAHFTPAHHHSTSAAATATATTRLHGSAPSAAVAALCPPHLLTVASPASSWWSRLSLALTRRSSWASLRRARSPKGKPDATISFTDNDFLVITSSKTNPQIAFIRGAIKIKGSISAAQKFTPDIFP